MNEKGMVIVHPNGFAELDYFRTKLFDHKGLQVSRRRWLQIYRPDCRVVVGVLTYPKALRAAKKGG